MTPERLAEIRTMLAGDTFPGGYDLRRVVKLLRDAGRELAAEVDRLAERATFYRDSRHKYYRQMVELGEQADHLREALAAYEPPEDDHTEGDA